MSDRYVRPNSSFRANLLTVLLVSTVGCDLISGPDVDFDFQLVSEAIAVFGDSVEVQTNVGEISIRGAILVYDCTKTTGSVDRDQTTLTLTVKNRAQKFDACTLGNHVDQYAARLYNLDAGDYRLVVRYDRSDRQDTVYDELIAVD